jgi:hypothetical protein
LDERRSITVTTSTFMIYYHSRRTLASNSRDSWGRDEEDVFFNVVWLAGL